MAIDMNQADHHPDVLVSLDEHVAIVEFSRPPNNFFDHRLIGSIADELEALASDGRTRVVVLCSTGRHFCAGMNFTDRSREGGTMGDLYKEGLRLFRQPLPIVAAIQGAAIGGGLGLALVADFRVATSDARISANFAQLGFHHGFGISATLPRAVGYQAAMDLLYTGRRITAEEAQDIGLVDKVTTPELLRDAARSLAEDIATSAPLAVRSIRETLRLSLNVEVSEAVVRELAEQKRLIGTSDFREGIAAAGERRLPIFSGE